MSALLQPVTTNTAGPSTADLREDAIRATLSALTSAAKRHDHVAVAAFSGAVHELWGS